MDTPTIPTVESGGIHSHVSECTILVPHFLVTPANRNGENAKQKRGQLRGLNPDLEPQWVSNPSP